MTAATHRAALDAVLVAAVPLMTVAGGYHFDYAAANLLLPVEWPADKAVLHYEWGDDSRNTQNRVAGSITYDGQLAVRILPPAREGFTPSQLAAAAVDDFKRLMFTLSEDLLQAGAEWISDPACARPRPRLIPARPVEAYIDYRLIWRQGRASPAPV